MGFSKGPTPPNATFPPPQAKGLLTTMIAEKKTWLKASYFLEIGIDSLESNGGFPDSQAYLLLGNSSCYEIIHSLHLKWEQLNLMKNVSGRLHLLRCVIKVGPVGGTKKKCAQELPSLNGGCNGDLVLCSLLILELIAE